MKYYQAITGTLTTQTALHVGSGDSDAATDAFVRRDAAGAWIIPGSSIAGVLRSIATKLAPRIGVEAADVTNICFAVSHTEDSDVETKDSDSSAANGPLCECIVCQLFGYRFLPSDEGSAIQPHASRLLVYDAYPAPTDLHPMIRDLVGIDRISGTSSADARAKFDLEVLPAHVRFPLRIEVVGDVDHLTRDEHTLLACALAEWKTNRAYLGGRSSRGMGSVQLDELQFVTRDLTSAKGLMRFLGSDEPWLAQTSDELATKVDDQWLPNTIAAARSKVVAKPPDAISASHFIDVRFTLRGTSPWLINDPTFSRLSGVDHAPILVQLTKGAAPFLPGSSLRGVLRVHAERLARTLAAQAAIAESEGHSGVAAEQFLLRCPACNPLQSNDQLPLTSCDKHIESKLSELVGRDRERLKQDLRHEIAAPAPSAERHFCLACQLFGSTRRASHLRVEDAICVNYESARLQDFLAIDRFTGGGLGGAKFDAVGIIRPTFQVRLFLENPLPWQIGWLALVLRDLRDGWLRFGFGGAKGYGKATMSNLEVHFGYLQCQDIPFYQDADPGWQSLIDASQPTDGLYQTAVLKLDEQSAASSAWLDAANRCIGAFGDLLRGSETQRFRRAALVRQLQDSYFNQPATVGDRYTMEELYPIARATYD